MATSNLKRNSKAKLEEPGAWTVFDMNARRRDKDGQVIGRTHTTRTGKDYKLFADQGTKMPESDARTFLIDGFRVLNEEGVEVRNIPDEATQDAGVIPRLQLGQTVAHYDELTNQALRGRCARKPGGERFNKNTSRKLLIDFLMGEYEPDAEEDQTPKKDKKTEPAPGENFDETGTAEMTGEEVDKMFDAG